MTFNQFDLEEQSDCLYDSLTIYDGSSTSAVQLGVYCGTNNPGTIRSSDNSLTVVFKSDESETRSGFYAEYSAFASVSCEFSFLRCLNY